MGETVLTHEQWLQRRRGFIGASDAASALGMSAWKTRLELAQEKWGEFTQEETEEMRRGTILEPLVAKMYERDVGRPLVKAEWMRSPDHEWMSAEPDFMDLHGEGTYVQTKTVIWWSRDDWINDKGEDVIPDHYMLQVQHEMAVTGCPRNCVAALFADANTFRALVRMVEMKMSFDAIADYVEGLIAMPNAQCAFVVIPATRDDGLVKDIIEGEKEFWTKYVVPKVEPPDASIPQKSPKILVADERQAAILLRLRQAKIDEKEAKARYEDVTEEVKKEIGEHAGIVADEIAKVSYKAPPPKQEIDFELAFAEVQRKTLAPNCAAAKKSNTVPSTDWEAAFKDLDMTEEAKTDVRKKFTTITQPKRRFSPTFPGLRKTRGGE